MKAVIHCSPSIPWQPKRAAYFAEGFKAVGIEVEITADRFRHDDGFPVLLGTSMWKPIEQDGGEFLLVDRCSFGDTEKYVSLVWNGHGRHGHHRVPHNPCPSRWERHGIELKPLRSGALVVLCGQIELFSTYYKTLDEWYQLSMYATHFRPHPAGINPTILPTKLDWNCVGRAVTLNSSVGVQCVMNGIATETWDPGSMARFSEYHEFNFEQRLPWCHWLAWTQWSDDEIKEGKPWAYHL